MKIGSFKIIDTQSRVAAGHELIIIPLFLPRAARPAGCSTRSTGRQTDARWHLATRNSQLLLAVGLRQKRGQVETGSTPQYQSGTTGMLNEVLDPENLLFLSCLRVGGAERKAEEEKK